MGYMGSLICIVKGYHIAMENMGNMGGDGRTWRWRG
jgi:hypothetical protein